MKSISTLKMKLINAVVGSDTKTLTKDEELVSFFKDEFDKARKEDEQLSWDTVHREAYDKALKDSKLMQTVQNVPRRSRVKRLETKAPGVVVFGKKGQNTIFTYGDVDSDVRVVSSDEALPYFEAKPDEKGKAVDKDFTSLFNIAKEKLFAKHELPPIKGRRASAINVLKVIAKDLPTARDYCEDTINIIRTLDDIPDGSLKDISQLDLRNVEDAYKQLKQIIPDVFVRNILNRAEFTEDEEELLLFAEQLV